jgi:hypothetical protein
MSNGRIEADEILGMFKRGARLQHPGEGYRDVFLCHGSEDNESRSSRFKRHSWGQGFRAGSTVMRFAGATASPQRSTKE